LQRAGSEVCASEGTPSALLRRPLCSLIYPTLPYPILLCPPLFLPPIPQQRASPCLLHTLTHTPLSLPLAPFSSQHPTAANKHQSVQLPSPWPKDRCCSIILLIPSTRRPPTTLVHARPSLLLQPVIQRRPRSTSCCVVAASSSRLSHSSKSIDPPHARTPHPRFLHAPEQRKNPAPNHATR